MDLFTSGSLAANNAALLLNARQKSVVYVQVTGTWVGTLSFQGTVDGTNWFSINVNDNTGAAPVTTATANGQWQASIAGLLEFRVLMSPYTSGSAVVTIHANAKR